MQTRVALTLTGLAAMIVAASPPVLADGGGYGGSTDVSCPPGATTCTVTAGDSGSVGSGSGASTRGATVTCTWQATTQQDAEASLYGLYPNPGILNWSGGMGAGSLVQYGAAGASDSWYFVTCSDGSGFVAEVAPGNGGGPTPAQVGQLAVSQLNLTSPSVSMAPPMSQGAVVGLESWMWVSPAEWRPITATATVGGIAATATATPEYVIWQMGNGEQQVRCNGPGDAYDPSIPDQDQSTYCGYTYQQTSAGQPNQDFLVTTTVVFHVTWTSVGAPGGGDLGLIPGQSTTTPLVVDEIGTEVIGQ